MELAVKYHIGGYRYNGILAGHIMLPEYMCEDFLSHLKNTKIMIVYVKGNDGAMAEGS